MTRMYSEHRKREAVERSISTYLSKFGLTLDSKQLTPAESAWGKYQRIQGWVDGLPSNFPTAEAVQGNIDNLERLIDTTGLEPEHWQVMADARDQLERLLAIVKAWTDADPFDVVNTLFTVPDGDVNFDLALDRASARAIQYALLFIPEAGNKTKRKRLMVRLTKLAAQVRAEPIPGKLPEETLAEWMERTGQLKDVRPEEEPEAWGKL